MAIRLLHVPSADWTGPQLRAALRMSGPTDAVERLEAAASGQLGVDVVAFGSCRAAIAALLTVLDVGTGRVLVPAYTCVAVPNAVRTAGRDIAWLDVEGANIGPALALSEAVAGDALIAQHTYGVPLDRNVLDELVGRGVEVVEDRAHRFDADDLAGQSAVWSLEHSKVVSAGQGGLAWARDPAVVAALRRVRDAAGPASDDDARRVLWTSAVNVALHGSPLPPAVSSFARRALRRIPVVSHPSQTRGELAGEGVEVRSLHPALAVVGTRSVLGLEANLRHRRSVTAIYRRRLGSLIPAWAREDLPFVRQPVVVADADAATARLRAAGFDLGVRWFNAPIHPAGSRSTYAQGSAPAAEALARSALSLPTHAGIDADTAEAVAAAVLAAAA